MLSTVYRPTKTFVQKHKTAIAVATTVIICAAISKAAMSQHDEFLKEHGLYEEFHALED